MKKRLESIFPMNFNNTIHMICFVGRKFAVRLKSTKKKLEKAAIDK